MPVMTGAGPRLDEGRRSLLLASLVLVGVALVGLAVGFLLSRGGGGAADTTAGTPSTARTTASAPTSPGVRPTVRAASQIERGRTTDIGYLLGARTRTDGLHVTFDRVQLLTGAQAQKYAKDHGIDPQTMRHGVIVNENPRTRDLVLAPDVAVYGGVQLAASTDLERMPLQKLLDALATQGGSIPLVLTYDRLGYVVKVAERPTG
jgi:hypothetical protein